MSIRKKRIIAVVELFITLAIIVYFFFPKNLEGALGLGFGREDLSEIQCHLSAVSLQIDETRDETCLPGTAKYEAIMDLLEEETYWPVYLDSSTKNTDVQKITHLTLVSEKGERYIPVNETGQILKITGTKVRDKTFRVSEGFQQKLMNVMVAKPETP